MQPATNHALHLLFPVHITLLFYPSCRLRGHTNATVERNAVLHTPQQTYVVNLMNKPTPYMPVFSPTLKA